MKTTRIMLEKREGSRVNKEQTGEEELEKADIACLLSQTTGPTQTRRSLLATDIFTVRTHTGNILKKDLYKEHEIGHSIWVTSMGPLSEKRNTEVTWMAWRGPATKKVVQPLIEADGILRRKVPPAATRPLPRPVVISGPSGSGKSTVLSRVMLRYPSSFAFSVSHTTRRPREGEQQGVHYWFTPKEEMERMISNGDFLENACFAGNIKKAVDEVMKTGRICVLDLELRGVLAIKKTNLNAKYIYIEAPSLECLKQRLIDRGTETDESLVKRLRHAKEDMDAVKTKYKGLFDYVITNSDLNIACREFLDAVAEELEQTLWTPTAQQ